MAEDKKRGRKQPMPTTVEPPIEKTRKPPGPTANPETVKGTGLNIRGRAIWLAWVNGLVKATPNGGKPLTTSALVERLLKSHAENIGYDPPPPR